MSVRLFTRFLCSFIACSILVCCCSTVSFASPSSDTSCCCTTSDSGCETVDTSCGMDHSSNTAATFVQKDILEASSNTTFSLYERHITSASFPPYRFVSISAWRDMMGAIRLQC